LCFLPDESTATAFAGAAEASGRPAASAAGIASIPSIDDMR
jgi:hypothetical protein